MPRVRVPLLRPARSYVRALHTVMILMLATHQPVLATLIAHSPIATIVIAGDLMFLSRAVWCHVLNIDMTDDPTYASL